MAITYVVYINKEAEEGDSCRKSDLKTTRKAEYTKFAKQALKDGAYSVDVWADIKNECDGSTYPSLVKTFYPEDLTSYSVAVNTTDNCIYETQKLNDAIKIAKNELNKSGVKKTFVLKIGDSRFTRSYTSKIYTNVRLKHAHLIKDEDGRICADLKSQNKSRDTSARYCFDTNTLVIAGKTIDKHPKFKNIDKFEDWVNCYFAKGKDGYDPDK